MSAMLGVVSVLTIMDSVSFAMAYGISFLGIAATITHALIHFWKPIQLHFRRSLKEQPDIHAQLMSRYPQGMQR